MPINKKCPPSSSCPLCLPPKKPSIDFLLVLSDTFIVPSFRILSFISLISFLFFPFLFPFLEREPLNGVEDSSIFDEPFPLSPGEKIVKKSSLTVVNEGEALHLTAIRDFEFMDGKEKVSKSAGSSVDPLPTLRKRERAFYLSKQNKLLYTTKTKYFKLIQKHIHCHKKQKNKKKNIRGQSEILYELMSVTFSQKKKEKKKGKLSSSKIPLFLSPSKRKHEEGSSLFFLWDAIPKREEERKEQEMRQTSSATRTRGTIFPKNNKL